MKITQKQFKTLSWKKLAKIYYNEKPNSPTRKAINKEALRCGYTPRIILALNY